CRILAKPDAHQPFLARHSVTCKESIIGRVGGEGGIRTHVPLTGQDAFEAPPLRPLRYLSAEESVAQNHLFYPISHFLRGRHPARPRCSAKAEHYDYLTPNP